MNCEALQQACNQRAIAFSKHNSDSLFRQSLGTPVSTTLGNSQGSASDMENRGLTAWLAATKPVLRPGSLLPNASEPDPVGNQSKCAHFRASLMPPAVPGESAAMRKLLVDKHSRTHSATKVFPSFRIAKGRISLHWMSESATSNSEFKEIQADVSGLYRHPSPAGSRCRLGQTGRFRGEGKYRPGPAKLRRPGCIANGGQGRRQTY